MPQRENPSRAIIAIPVAIALAISLGACSRWGYIEFDSPPADFAENYTARRALTISIPVDTTFDDFVIPVEIEAQDFPGLLSTGGDDVRFLDADGLVLAHEIEVWRPQGSSLIWVRVPVLEDGMTLWLYLGDAEAPVAAEPQVWPGEFAAVWHLTSTQDSSAWGNHLTDAGTSNTAGLLGDARLFDPSVAAHMLAPYSDSMASDGGELTLSASINFNDLSNRYQVYLTRPFGTASTSDFWAGADTGSHVLQYLPDAGLRTILNTGESTVTDSWVSYAAVIDATTISLYIDGQQLYSQPAAGSLTNSINPVYIGADTNDGGANRADLFSGILDEIRIQTSAKSPDWIATDHSLRSSGGISWLDLEELNP